MKSYDELYKIFRCETYRLCIKIPSFDGSVVWLNKPRCIIRFLQASRNVFAIIRADVLSHRKT